MIRVGGVILKIYVRVNLLKNKEVNPNLTSILIGDHPNIFDDPFKTCKPDWLLLP